MTYLTKLNEENIESGYLCILKPAIIVTGWTLLSGTTYYKSFSHHVSGVSANGIALTEMSSMPTSSKFWYDYTNEIIYINHNPTGETIVVTFELYFGTSSEHWYRIPTDTTSRQVFWDGTIISTPTFRASVINNFFGFMESNSSSIKIGNADSDFESIIYNSSFSNKDIYIYHWVETLSDIKLVYKAKMRDVGYDRNTVTVSIMDRVDQFSNEYRGTFLYTTTFSGLDPSYEGKPVRNVYGKVFQAFLVNADYNNNNPTTSDNRKWIVREGSTNQVTRTVGSGSTTTLTYLDSVNGLNVGDSVIFIKASTEYGLITGVDTINNTISHGALSVACIATNTVERPTAQVYIEKDGVVIRPLYGLDYTEANEGGCVVINFVSGMEARLSVSVLNPYDKVFADIYGKNNNVTEIWTGANSARYACMTNPIAILYDLIKNKLGDTSINTSNFNTYATTFAGYELGFSIPENINSPYPTYKEILINIFTSLLIKFFLDTDNNWKIKPLAVLGTANKTIAIDEILDNSLEYEFGYSDIISEVIVNSKYNEYLNNYETISQPSLTATYLHNINKQKEFNTYLLANANTVATTLKNLFGDRQGTLSIDVKNRFFDTYVGDIIEIQLEKLPGFAYDETIHSRKFDLVEINKGLKKISLVLNDQKGIEEA